MAVLLAAIGGSAPVSADPLPVAVPERAEPVDFAREVAGILRANCLACHNAAKSEGGLVMESVAAMTKGGDGGPAVVPGKPEQSPLFLRAAHRLDDPMPPADNDAGARPLTPGELGLVRLWIDQGARGGDTIGASAPRAWRRLPAGTGPVLAVAVSPDGGLVAGGRAGRLAVFDAATAARLADLVDPALASGSGPGPVPAHADVVRAVAFDPRGERLASGGYREVKLWRRGREFVPLPAVPAPAAPAAPADAAGLVKIVEQARGAAMKLAAEPAARAAAVAKQDLAHEEHELATAVKEGAASRRAVETARTAREAAAKAVAAAEEKRKAAEAALAEARQVAAVLPAGATPASSSPAPTNGAKNDMQAADMKRLDDATKTAAAAATDLEQRRDEDVSAARVLEVALAGAARADAEQAAGEAAVAAMKQAVAAADAVVAARAREAEQLPPLVAVAAATEGDASGGPDGGPVAGLEADGTLHLATRAGRPLARLVPPPGVPREGFVGVSFAAEGRVVVRRGDGSGGSWPVAATWTLEAVIGNAGDERTLPGFVTSLAFSPDGRRLAVGCGEPARPGSVVVCDVAGGTAGGVVARLEGSHGDEPLGVSFEPERRAAGGRLATVAADRTLRVFAVDAAAPPDVFEGHTQQVLGVSWQAHGRRIATASADGTVKIWDVPNVKQERSVAENGREATAVRFLGTGTDLLVAATKGLRVVNAADGRTLRTCAEVMGHVHAIDVSADGTVAAAASADGRMHLWATDGKTPARTIEP